VRGSRIKNVVDELGGERIDIVRWNDSLQVMIPNALQPASIEEVFLYSRLGRAIVLVQEDQLSLAIGRRGQNVRLASKLVGWDIEIMTHDELGSGIERAEGWFRQLPHSSDEIVEMFIEEGFLSYDDLTFMEPAQLGELCGITEEQADEMIAFAEEAAERVGEETRAAKAEAGPSQRVQSPSRPSAPTAADIFREPLPTEQEEPKMTAEKLFGTPSNGGAAPTPDAEPAAESAPAEPMVEVSEVNAEAQETESQEKEPVQELGEQQAAGTAP
jgi:transcription termination/antitermination protein NusA